jgi:hypothetical protein
LPFRDFRDDEIRRLRTDLYDARQVLLDLLPSELRTLLSGWRHDMSEQDFYRWKRDTVAAIIGIAQPLPLNRFDGPRAMCPLCGRGSSWPYTEGYALPGGLERHLVGEGKTYRRPVTKHAFDLARGCLEESFEAARAEEKIREEERRRTETLFL